VEGNVDRIDASDAVETEETAAFQAVFDLGRAQEWTAALERWTESEPDVITYRGRCRVFRSELLRLHGQWQDAVAEVALARDWLLRPPPAPAVGEAYYQQAELARLRGAFSEAEASYREGATWGRRPDPGLALLRLAQGDVATAAAMIRRALDEVDPIGRPRLLEPAVEVLLAAGDAPGSRSALAQLEELARLGGQRPWPRALAAEAEGRVRLAEHDPSGALAALRRAEGLWRTLDAPYETARVRVAVARACRELGDDETATIELAAARDVFDRLGAIPDRDQVDQLAGMPPPVPGGLSPRELEVVRLVAAGATNREIAERLGISGRTVDRHVSNIFAKLDVASRAAATAFAYEHRLV